MAGAVLWSGAALAVSGCTQNANSAAATTSETAGQLAGELPMPQIPETITDRNERIAYACNHFWDSMDFNDTTLSLNPEFMEQNFANFALFLSYQPDETARREAARIFLKKAAVNGSALDMARKVARQYLGASDSPMRNDLSWMAFLDVMSGMPEIPEADRARYAYEAEVAAKNRPGTIAADFAFETRGGKPSTLHTTPAGSEGLILLFYDPDCDHCRETIDEMVNSEKLAAKISSGEYALLAVDVEENKAAWVRTNSELPGEWTVGFDTESILDNDLYAIPSLPSIYILDRDYTVKAREASLYDIIGEE